MIGFLRRFNVSFGQQSFSEEQARHWLTWLAKRMVLNSQTIFLIERMQPKWMLTTQEKWLYMIGVRLIVGIIAGLISAFHTGPLVSNDLPTLVSLMIFPIIGGLIAGLSSFVIRVISESRTGLIFRVINGVIPGLIYVLTATSLIYPQVQVNQVDLRSLVSPLLIDGVVLGLFFSLIPEDIKIIDTTDWSWSKARNYSRWGLMGGLIYVLIRLRFTNRYRNWTNLHDFRYSAILIELLLFTLLAGLIGGLDRVNINQSTRIPNQGIWRTAINTLFYFTIFFLIGIPSGLPYAKDIHGMINIHEVISYGLAVGLLAGLAGGKGPIFAGLVLIQHFVLRVLLWRKGYVPWNYARFLDYATERVFLRKVGGGYIFIHRMLLEHFAQMDS